MRIIDTAFNVAFARAMAKHNSPEAQEEKAVYFNKRPGSHFPERKTTLIARAAYSRAIHDRINDIRR